ncbi:MAG TPA: hypothetical protein VLZ75_06675 [Chitinophagales bacterium]|nr:hypothetical protein [Chitinophagales bacterium]
MCFTISSFIGQKLYACGTDFGVVQKYYSIPFGSSQSIHCSNGANDVIDWSIIDQNIHSIVAKGNGTITGNYFFESPSEYWVISPRIITPQLGHTDHLHRSNDSAYIRVSNVKVKFNLDELYLSKPIKKRQSTSGTILTIPIDIELYNNKSDIFKNVKVMRATGVRVDVFGSPESSTIKLNNGKIQLRYHLQGSKRRGIYHV